jgi:CubicO group peptidase (beta-lactamase class C family)
MLDVSETSLTGAAAVPSRRQLDIDHVFTPARDAAGTGRIPCAVAGVSDAWGTFGIHAYPGPRQGRVGTDSVFFLASVTKPITATAVMQQVEAGALDLHAPIREYVPEFSGDDKERVTAWHVLTHTSGIPDLDQDALRRQRPGYAQMLRHVCRDPLQFEPGSRYAYASDSFFLLAEAIARVAGVSYPSALRRGILDPLAMTDTTFDPRRMRSRVMTMHGIPLRNWIVESLILRFLANATMPGGGLFGTAEDLLRFGRSLLPGAAEATILQPAAIAEMTREQTRGIPEVQEDGSTREPRYALGWGKPNPDGTIPSVLGTPIANQVRVPASPSTFTHGGASGTRLWIDPDRGLVFVFLTNEWSASDEPMFATLASLYTAWDET